MNFNTRVDIDHHNKEELKSMFAIYLDYKWSGDTLTKMVNQFIAEKNANALQVKKFIVDLLDIQAYKKRGLHVRKVDEQCFKVNHVYTLIEKNGLWCFVTADSQLGGSNFGSSHAAIMFFITLHI